MDWGQVWPVLGAIGGSSITTAVLSHYLHRSSKSKEEKYAVRYLATNICFVLERFCILVASDHADTEDALHSQGQIGALRTGVREFPALPVSENYDLFDNALLNRILDFPDRVTLANDKIAREADHATDEMDLAETASKECKDLGIAALNLAEEIRAQYDLPKRSLVYGNYSVRRWLSLSE